MVLKKLISFAIILFVFTTGKAQVSGVIYDRISRKALVQVEIVNLTSKEKTSSNNRGEFTINAKVNQLLVFSRMGYLSDTLLLIDLKPLRRYLSLDKNTLNTITISGKKTLREIYAQEFNKANPILLAQGRGLLFYPSAYFSREGRNARRFVRMIKWEEKEKVIDRRFNLNSISKLIPLKQPQLDAFFIRYRPSRKHIERLSDDDLKAYVLDCYRKFKMLPPEKQVLDLLTEK